MYLKLVVSAKVWICKNKVWLPSKNRTVNERQQLFPLQIQNYSHNLESEITFHGISLNTPHIENISNKNFSS